MGATPADFPAVGAVNGGYIAVWSDYRAGLTSQVFAAHVDGTGTATPAAGKNLGLGQNPALGCSPTTCLVAYSSRDSTKVLYRRIDAAAVPIDPGPTGVGDGQPWSVVWTGVQWFLAYVSGGRGYLQAVGAGGALSGPQLDLGPNVESVQLAISPTRLLVVTTVAQATYELLAELRSLDGAVLTASQQIATGINATPSVSAAFSGSAFTIVYSAGGQAFGRRISPTGVLEPTSTPFPGAVAVTDVNVSIGDGPGGGPSTTTVVLSQSDPLSRFRWFDMAADPFKMPATVGPPGGVGRPADLMLADGGGLTLWVDYRWQTRPLFVAPLPWPLEGKPLLTNAAPQARASIAAEGSGFVVGWVEPTSLLVGGIFVRSVTASGAPAGAPVPLFPLAVHPLLVALGNLGPTPFAVYGTEGNSNMELRWARLGPGLMPTAELTLDPTADLLSRVTVANHPTQPLLAWTRFTPTGDDTFLARLRLDGGTPDVPPLRLISNDDQQRPSAAASASRYLVAFEEHGPDAGISAHLFDLSLNTLRASHVQGSTIAALSPGVGSDGTDFLVAWTDGDSSQRQILASRFSAAGVQLDVPPLQLLAPSERALGSIEASPTVTFDGTRYLVAFDVLSGDRTALWVRGVTAGALITDAGVVDTAAIEESPFVFSASAGRVLMTYRTPAMHESSAVAVTFSANVPPGGFCESGDECLVGICRLSQCVADAGSDAGSVADAGVADAGVADAGQGDPDAGSVASDAGVITNDAGTQPTDGGIDDLEPRTYSAGCGCQSSPSALLLALLLAFTARRFGRARLP